MQNGYGSQNDLSENKANSKVQNEIRIISSIRTIVCLGLWTSCITGIQEWEYAVWFAEWLLEQDSMELLHWKETA